MPIAESRCLVQRSRAERLAATGHPGAETVGARRVMIVEDDLAFARAAEAHLTRAGFVVDIGTDAFDALNKVEAQRFDLLILDIAMPAGKPSGLSLARMIRHRKPDARIIFVTGYRDLANFAAQLPGKVFVKPIDLEALVLEMRSALSA